MAWLGACPSRVSALPYRPSTQCLCILRMCACISATAASASRARTWVRTRRWDRSTTSPPVTPSMCTTSRDAADIEVMKAMSNGFLLAVARRLSNSTFADARSLSRPASVRVATSAMFCSRAERSASSRLSQARRTINDSTPFRASERSVNEKSDRRSMSEMLTATRRGSAWAMNAPPVAPRRNSTSPATSNIRIASRTVFRLTANCSANARSDGRRSPVESSPRCTSSRICEVISSKARRGCAGVNLGVVTSRCCRNVASLASRAESDLASSAALRQCHLQKTLSEGPLSCKDAAGESARSSAIRVGARGIPPGTRPEDSGSLSALTGCGGSTRAQSALAEVERRSRGITDS